MPARRWRQWGFPTGWSTGRTSCPADSASGGNPKLLLADEPTGALDSASGAAVMELFQQLHDGGSTIIMITHDRSIADHAAKVMTIRDGVLSGGDDHE